MLRKATIAVGTAVLLCGSAVAQTSGSQSPAATQPSGPNSQSGTTSGPASGSPTTLGTTGTTTATPHQMEGVRDQSSSVKRETEQGAQSGSTDQPGSAGTGQPGSVGTEAGPAPNK